MAIDRIGQTGVAESVNNDTICLMLTPLVIAVIRRGKLPLLPYLIALATSANIVDEQS